jgi:hypothetical protein
MLHAALGSFPPGITLDIVFSDDEFVLNVSDNGPEHVGHTLPVVWTMMPQ